MAGRHPLFIPLVLAGGVLFGFGLAYSHMARPEVVLDFLQFEDLGLVFVMFGGAGVTAVAYLTAPRVFDEPPLAGNGFTRRLKPFDLDVVVGGTIFGVGWGLSGICPGAAYASLGIGNLTILWAIAGMFLGAFLQGYWRSQTSVTAGRKAGAD